MKEPRRSPLWIAGIFGVALLSLLMVGFGWSVIRAGVFEVTVQDAGPAGCDLNLIVPAAFVHTALKIVPDRIFEELRHELDHEIGDHWNMILAAAKELDEIPDGLLVEVSDRDEHVRVSKNNGHYHVEVTDGDDEISVVLPEGFVYRVLREIAPKEARRGSHRI